MGSTPIPNPTPPSYPKVLMLGNSTTCKKLDIISDSSSAMSPIQGANRFGKLYLLNLSWIHPFLHWLPPSPLTWKMSLALLISFLPSSNLLCNEIKKKNQTNSNRNMIMFFPWGKKKTFNSYSSLWAKSKTLCSAWKALHNLDSSLFLYFSTLLSFTGL